MNITVDLLNIPSGKEINGDYSLSLYDEEGKMVAEGSMVSSNTKSYTFKNIVSTSESVIYTVKIKTANSKKLDMCSISANFKTGKCNKVGEFSEWENLLPPSFDRDSDNSSSNSSSGTSSTSSTNSTVSR